MINSPIILTDVDKDPKLYIITVTKSNIKLFDVLKHVIIPEILLLEKGFKVNVADGKDVTIVGGLHMIKGDHIGLTETAGINGPRSKRPSKYCRVY